MKKTMIYLPETDYINLRLLAESENLSMAELIRDFIKKGLSKKKIASGASFLKKLANYKVKGGRKLAIKVDTIYR